MKVIFFQMIRSILLTFFKLLDLIFDARRYRVTAEDVQTNHRSFLGGIYSLDMTWLNKVKGTDG